MFEANISFGCHFSNRAIKNLKQIYISRKTNLPDLRHVSNTHILADKYNKQAYFKDINIIYEFTKPSETMP